MPFYKILISEKSVWFVFSDALARLVVKVKTENFSYRIGWVYVDRSEENRV